jgi:integrase
VVIGFYRTGVIDGVLAHSPADYVRRPTVSPQSPTLGLTHLQFEAMLTAARLSPNLFDFALVCLLGLLGLRIFDATSLDIAELGEEHGHRVLRVVGKGHARRRRRPARHPNRRPPRRPAHDHALRPHQPRQAPQLHPRRVHVFRDLTRPELPMCDAKPPWGRV